MLHAEFPDNRMSFVSGHCPHSPATIFTPLVVFSIQGNVDSGKAFSILQGRLALMLSMDLSHEPRSTAKQLCPLTYAYEARKRRQNIITANEKRVRCKIRQRSTLALIVTD